MLKKKLQNALHRNQPLERQASTPAKRARSGAQQRRQALPSPTRPLLLNVPSRTIFCHDNLDVLRGINSGSVDLVYLDPPFNKKKKFTAPIGSAASGTDFSDIFRAEDVKAEWLQTIKAERSNLHNFLESIRTMAHRGHNYNFCYLAYMAVRLMEIHRVLKHTGTMYLHCDPTMSHYLKVALDCIFGEGNFRNEIVWGYKFGGHSKRGFAKKHDIILRYSKSDVFVFNDHLMREYHTRSNWGQREDGKLLTDWWGDIPVINTMAKERTGFPTQKPLPLLQRLIAASSREGDKVLDPFCGSAAACIAAEKLGRGWMGIDINCKACELILQRMKNEGMPDVNFSATPPARTDAGAGNG